MNKKYLWWAFPLLVVWGSSYLNHLFIDMDGPFRWWDFPLLWSEMVTLIASIVIAIKKADEGQ